MPPPRVLILRAPGANCDEETAFAFAQAGAVAEPLHLQQLRAEPRRLLHYQILAIPGGFTYGDDVAAGKILANQLRHFLGDVLREFRNRERLLLGICNGFQVLLKAGLLLPPDEDGPLATLAHNASGKFVDKWATLAVTPGKCPFLKGCTKLYLPVAHGEGRFVCRQEWILKGLEQTGQIVLRYEDDNPSGAQGNVAGLCDATGRVLGLMPHPERHTLPTQHPHWTRLGLAPEGEGLKLFRNAVEFFR